MAHLPIQTQWKELREGESTVFYCFQSSAKGLFYINIATKTNEQPFKKSENPMQTHLFQTGLQIYPVNIIHYICHIFQCLDL